MQKPLIILLVLAFLIPQTAEAQLFKKLKDATKKKIEDRIEQKVVEELSEELARRAMKPINKAFDEYIKEAYRSEQGEDYDPEKFDSVMQAAGRGYGEFLSGLNKAANIPESYSFDYLMAIETQEGNKEKEKITTEMYFSGSGGAIGYGQNIKQDDYDKMFMVMDPKNDVMVMYTEKNGKKTAQAVPSMFSLAKGFGAAYADEMDYSEIRIEPTGKTKKILGYNCQEYKGESEEDRFQFYSTNDLPFDWQDVYGDLIKSIAPKIFESSDGKFPGMALKSETYDKKEKRKYKWEVKKIEEKNLTLKTSDYEIRGLMDN